MSDRLQYVKDLVDGDRFIFDGVERKLVVANGVGRIEPPLESPLYYDSVVELVLDVMPIDGVISSAEDVGSVDEIQHALDRGFEPGPWWRINDKEGNTMEITRSPKDYLFFKSLAPKDVVIFREYVRTEVEWIKETPKL